MRALFQNCPRYSRTSRPSGQRATDISSTCVSDRPLLEYGQDAQAHVIPGLAFRQGERQKSEKYEQPFVRTGQCAALIGGSVWFSKKKLEKCVVADGAWRLSAPSARRSITRLCSVQLVSCFKVCSTCTSVTEITRERERERDRE